jgi:hypothetical protein
MNGDRRCVRAPVFDLQTLGGAYATPLAKNSRLFRIVRRGLSSSRAFWLREAPRRLGMIGKMERMEQKQIPCRPAPRTLLTCAPSGPAGPQIQITREISRAAT